MKFTEYYQHYLTLHQNKWCRRLHALGQLATILTAMYIFYTQTWWLLLALPFVVYPFISFKRTRKRNIYKYSSSFHV